MSRANRALLLWSSWPVVTAFTAASLQGIQVQQGSHAHESTNSEDGVQAQSLLWKGNPIYKVEKLLQAMMKKNEALDFSEAKLAEDANCLCKGQIEEQTAIVKGLKEGLPELEAEVGTLEAEESQLKGSTEKLDSDIKAVKDGMAAVDSMKEKEFGDVAKQIADDKASILALDSAIQSLTKGIGGSFLQTSGAATIRKIVSSNSDTSGLTDTDRDQLSSFLEDGAGSGEGSDGPSTSEVIGMLKQMKDSFQTNLDKAESAYSKGTKEHEELAKVKQRQLDSMQGELTEKNSRLGEIGTLLVQKRQKVNRIKGGDGDKEESRLTELKESCKATQDMFEKAKQDRAKENVLLTDIIAYLTSADAIGVFKTSLPAASSALLQMQTTKRQLLQRARAALYRHDRRSYRIDLIALAMSGKKVDFTKVKKMINDLIESLVEQQTSEQDKRDNCWKLTNKMKADIAVNGKKAGETKTSIELYKLDVQAVAEQVVKDQEEIDKLTSEGAEAKKQRGEQVAEFQKEWEFDAAALKLLRKAEERLKAHFLALSQVSSDEHSPVKYDPEAHKNDGVEVLALLRKLINEVDIAMHRNKNAEAVLAETFKRSEADLVSNLASKKENIAKLESQKARLDEKVQTRTDRLDREETLVEDTQKTLTSFHTECIDTLARFEDSQEARAAEIDALKYARNVLAGADYGGALIQERHSHQHLQRKLRGGR